MATYVAKNGTSVIKNKDSTFDLYFNGNFMGSTDGLVFDVAESRSQFGANFVRDLAEIMDKVFFGDIK